MSSVVRLVSVLILTILILYLSYLFTKTLGKGIGMKRGGAHMQMLDRLTLGQDKSVAIICAGSRYYLIGIASSQITVLAELSEEEISKQDIVSASASGPVAGYEAFHSLLKKYSDKHKKDV